jgi:hypothetical protein
MTPGLALFLLTVLVLAPVAIGVFLARRFGKRMTAFHWAVFGCSLVGLWLSGQGLEDAFKGHRPWSSALTTLAMMVALPTGMVLLSAVQAMPGLAVESLLRRLTERRPRGDR